MENFNLAKSLNSVGKKSFVEDYEIYSRKEWSTQEKVTILSKKYSISGSKIRVSFSNTIFKLNKQKDALKLIIESPCIERSIIDKAKHLYLQEK